MPPELQQTLNEIRAICADETDEIALMATISCHLYQQTACTNNWMRCCAICLPAGLKMPPDQNREDDAVLSKHLQDQFVAWFVGVMALVYLVEYLHENQKKKQNNHHNHLKTDRP